MRESRRLRIFWSIVRAHHRLQTRTLCDIQMETSWYVCEKTVHTKNNKKMCFGTFLDADGNFVDTTHFTNNTPMYPFKGSGYYLILGKVVSDFGFPSIEVGKFAKLPITNNPIMD